MLWRYTRQGQTCGPVSSAQLKGLLVAEQIHPQQLVWGHGSQASLVLTATAAVLRGEDAGPEQWVGCVAEAEPIC
jgi:hypothetical protein